MLLPRRVFRFQGCLRAKATTPRTLRTHANPPSTDDRQLLHFFDNAPPPPRSQSHGFLLNKQITSPESFGGIAQCTVMRANYILGRILRAETDDERLRIVKDTDRLGDLICRTIDLAELVRHVHPDRAWVQAANEIYDVLLEYMNSLNTNPELSQVGQSRESYSVSDKPQALDRLISSPLFHQLLPETQQTALTFQHDFHQSGIDLPDAKRQRFVQLSSKIFDHGRTFVSPVSGNRRKIALQKEDLEGLPSNARSWKIFTLNNGLRTTVPLDVDSMEAHYIMKYSNNDEVRKKIHITQHSGHETKIEALENLLRARAELSALVGKQSYAHMLLERKMAKSPGEHSRSLHGLLN